MRDPEALPGTFHFTILKLLCSRHVDAWESLAFRGDNHPLGPLRPSRPSPRWGRRGLARPPRNSRPLLDPAPRSQRDSIATELGALGAEVVRALFLSGSDAITIAKAGGSLDAALKAANWVSAGTPPERPPAAPGATTEPEPTTDTGEVVLAFGDRRWRVGPYPPAEPHPLAPPRIA